MRQRRAERATTTNQETNVKSLSISPNAILRGLPSIVTKDQDVIDRAASSSDAIHAVKIYAPGVAARVPEECLRVILRKCVERLATGQPLPNVNEIGKAAFDVWEAARVEMVHAVPNTDGMLLGPRMQRIDVVLAAVGYASPLVAIQDLLRLLVNQGDVRKTLRAMIAGLERELKVVDKLFSV
jgi:hypothetical protein